MRSLLLASMLLASCQTASVCSAATKTWDGKYDTSKIEVTVVYFVPGDRPALKDWRDRVNYFCKRIEQFHAREFQQQSTLTTVVHPEPMVSEHTTGELRQGDANAIYNRTLQEADRRLKFAQAPREAFPILLVLSEINWRPLDDFYRLHPHDGGFAFEGNDDRGQHFPGAASGGARAAYLSDRGIGWGLVSADGWRVPYRGSDCVVYHEGCGHTVGLPHPEPANGSVMSLAQYRGWISESWLDKEQKVRLQWEPEEVPNDAQTKLFTEFRALPVPQLPAPGQPVRLALNWPDGAKVNSLRVRFQTAVEGPWIDVTQQWNGDAPTTAALATFDRATPVSYRVDATLDGGETAELWGYFQVRENPERPPQPMSFSPDLIVRDVSADSSATIKAIPQDEVDLLAMTDLAVCWSQGEWSKADGKILSPRGYGMRLELPYAPPDEYRLTVIVEPLDEPNGLLFGQRCGDQRFVTLFSFHREDSHLSAIENIDGRNVGNETTFDGKLFRQQQLSQVIVTVRKDHVSMSVDGHMIVQWKGTSDRLSLSDYWNTPNETALFLGTYDCRYRFHRLTLEPLTGNGHELTKKPGE